MKVHFGRLKKGLPALLFVALVLAVVLAAAPPAAATAGVNNVTIKVVDSQGNPLPGVTMHAFKPNVGGINFPGSTDANGEISADLPWSGTGIRFTARYMNSSAAQNADVLASGNSSPLLTFQTEAATIMVADCGGNPVAGAQVSYFIANSGGGAVGTTGASGVVATELFAGTYRFDARLNNTIARTDVDITGGAPVDHTFVPTTMNLSFSGSVTFFNPNVGGGTVTAGTLLFPGTYEFRFAEGGNTYKVPWTVSGCTMMQAVNILKVKDSSGAPIAGATARGGFGNSFGTWHVAGSSDANGVLIDVRNVNSAPTTMSYEMRVNNSTAVLTQDVSANSVFEFQTQLLTVRMETCGGTPLDGGVPAYGTNTATGTWFFPGGATGTSAPGESKAELFPGVFSFRMTYKGTTDYRYSFTFPADGAVVTFQTTTVTLNYPGAISMGGATGDSRFFGQPTEELLPGTYKFHFRPIGSYPGYRTDLVLSGCVLNQTLVSVAVDDCAGGYMPGVDVQWYKWGSAGTKYAAGTTSSGGPLSFLIDGLAYSKIAVLATYKDASLRAGPQTVATDPFFVYNLQTAVVDLQTHTGADIPMDASNNLKFYAWGHASSKHDMTLVGGNGQQCLLPGNYVFNVDYQAGRASSGKHDIASPYVFQTGQVFNGTFDATLYYRWGNAGNKVAFFEGIELLPGKYGFVGSSTKIANVVSGQVLNLGDLSYSTIVPLSTKLEQTGKPGD